MSTALSAGASLAGVADLSLLRDVPVFGALKLDSFKYAVSIAVALPKYVFEMITRDDPGELYAHAYKTANYTLDNIAFRVASKIFSYGYHALVIPASMIIDMKNLVAHVSHKPFAWAAGFGWIGRNGLLINPRYGPRIRLATVLTDMPLKPNKPFEENLCGDCRLCVENCPSGALKYRDFKVRPNSREEIFDAQKCFERLKTLKDRPWIKETIPEYGFYICGMCIKVCPWGKEKFM
ncbi:MAG: epoxyqueuosine reductase [Candidatus Methanomethylicota archaeon]|uniref:Epoxyqueuosine reductase n=1 Tax=Thermoproteota archaeon TaxID=2056631 RepID=A0A497EZ24_9CREN|nr:MAG: epoxyqueuosine reductase [Candidatus Verstraetearchaeota archaeon]